MPGVLAFLGLFLIAASFSPALLQQLARWTDLGWWVTLPLLFAYVLGHLLQALANLVTGRLEDSLLTKALGELPASSYEAVGRRLSAPELTVADLKGAPYRFLAMCTQILEQGGKTGTRDLYL